MFRRTRAFTLASGLLVAGLLGAACSDDSSDDEEASEEESDSGAQTSGGTLAAVIDRGTLNCGVNNSVPGFGFETADGTFEGFDIDYCKAIAAAVLGDPEAVEYVPLTPEQRFPSLASGEIDVLARNTTWTSTRDGAEGAAFVTTTFYDGQAMMVPAASGVTSIDDAGGRHDLPDRRHDDRAEPGRPHGRHPAHAADLRGERAGPGGVPGRAVRRLDVRPVASSPASAPTGPPTRAARESLTILDETFSKEPLGPAVVDGDSEWFDVVNWVVLATIEAEELGITADNLDQMLESEDPAVRRFLGQPVEVEGEEAVVDHGFGVDPDFTVDVIRRRGQLRRDLRPQRRAGHGAPDRPRGHGQRPVDRGWPALLPAVPLIGGH